jgi:hypothetical protein
MHAYADVSDARGASKDPFAKSLACAAGFNQSLIEVLRNLERIGNSTA